MADPKPNPAATRALVGYIERMAKTQGQTWDEFETAGDGSASTATQ